MNFIFCVGLMIWLLLLIEFCFLVFRVVCRETVTQGPSIAQAVNLKGELFIINDV